LPDPAGRQPFVCPGMLRGCKRQTGFAVSTTSTAVARRVPLVEYAGSQVSMVCWGGGQMLHIQILRASYNC
jgi:hypothetical protein